MVDERLESLFEAHQLIGKEIGKVKVRGDESEWREGYINGLEEANNRVEEAIYNTVEMRVRKARGW